MLFHKSNKNNNPSVIDVANYFLNQDRPNEHWNLTNYKLQSLVYYAQGWSLALRNKAMFHNKLESWACGVVCPDLYYLYGNYGFYEVISQTFEDLSASNDDDRDLLIAVWNQYGFRETDKLRFMIGCGLPWKNAWSNMKEGRGNMITDEYLQSYFKSLLVHS